ncbi:protein O-mannosyl-transferase family [Marinifilum sp. RC60d5]|uniref:protein O-mannosyl-transferase family n=1 Tax=Marinifilum sp. RC60d5 TaxID=3458414 RepID=UPI00403653EC
MKSNYRLVNNVLGWVAFIIAAITYLLTIEPTASLWDCGEFITTAYGLEVGHPPGAPLFMIMARFFALFAPSPAQAALMVNVMSALASAFTILFLFWTITHLAKKIVGNETELTKANLFAVMGTGLVGALAYTFSDTFWFSAVEGEVYASSSLFTAVVFWAILKWEDVAHEKNSNRWLILIAYLMGLSIGVHLLNLLAIPAIVFVYYFKKYEPTRNGIIGAAVLSVSILATIMYGIIPGVVKVASWFELLFVNGFGLPYNTGVMVYAILVISAVVWAINYSIKKNMVILNTILTAFVVIVIGYSSFAMIVIRSSANPPMDENNPDNVFALLSYLNREQYGDRPLLYGEYYNAPAIDLVETKPNYIQKNGKYVIASRKQQYKFDSRFETIFPRMYSSRDNHVRQYESWGGVKKDNPVTLGNGEVVYKPSFGSNLKFFFNYQIGHMYWRYFMWNFAGRQNDIQGHGGILNGNWISGIDFIDEMKVGNQDKLYPELKNKKSRNTYFLLPFILGLIGLIYQFRSGKQGKQDFTVVMLLFLLTGLAIVVYLNQYPYQPRERDYAYAGSFYAFAIWIGFGVMGLYQSLKKYMPDLVTAGLVTGICLIAVPGLMAQQNWDDHDRSGRYATLAYAKDYLNSCAPDAILFTYGDNDTFPLWYAQEVEGIRRDIRIVNLSLLAGDWYINQMRMKAYDSDPIPMTMGPEKIEPGVRDQVPIIERFKKAQDLGQMIDFVASDSVISRVEMQTGRKLDFFPGKSVYVPVDSAKVVANGTVRPEDAHLIVDRLEWKLKRNYLYKNDIMVYDIIASNKWERPIYFSVGMGISSFLGMEDYFQLEGAAYRLVPIKTKTEGMEIGRINSDVLYDNFMNKFEFGRIKEKDVYVDQFHILTLNIMSFRSNYSRLASKLNDEGKNEKAVKVLDRCMEELPAPKIPYDNSLIGFIQEYYRAGATEKANKLLTDMAQQSHDKLNYYFSLQPALGNSFRMEQEREIRVVQMLLGLADMGEQTKLKEETQQKFEFLFKSYRE